MSAAYGGPWYESSGPDAAYVRKNQFEHYQHKADMAIGFKPYMIMQIIREVIPDGTTGFGSYRGYSTFGLDDDFKTKIRDKISMKRQECALKIITNWFVEIMFRPNCIGYTRVKKEFEGFASKN